LKPAQIVEALLETDEFDPKEHAMELLKDLDSA
jgi:hypothetical protein